MKNLGKLGKINRPKGGGKLRESRSKNPLKTPSERDPGNKIGESLTAVAYLGRLLSLTTNPSFKYFL